MMVSRYLLDVVIIAGLVIGSLGVLYLSYGVFGKSGPSIVRPLFPALAFAIAFPFSVIIQDKYPVVENHQITSPYFLPPNLHWLELSLYAIAGFILGYVIVAIGRPGEVARQLGVYVGVILVLEVIANALLVLFYHDPLASAIVSVVGSLALFLLMEMAALVSALSEKQLQALGLIFTFLGVAAQFVQPLLDLLNIKVV